MEQFAEYVQLSWQTFDISTLISYVVTDKQLTSGVAQWLDRWSLTGELSLIYTWSMADMWPLRGQGVRYGLTNHANSAFHPFGVSKWVVIHVITWITEVETIKRQTGTVRMVV